MSSNHNNDLRRKYGELVNQQRADVRGLSVECAVRGAYATLRACVHHEEALDGIAQQIDKLSADQRVSPPVPAYTHFLPGELPEVSTEQAAHLEAENEALREAGALLDCEPGEVVGALRQLLEYSAALSDQAETMRKQIIAMGAELDLLKDVSPQPGTFPQPPPREVPPVPPEPRKEVQAPSVAPGPEKRQETTLSRPAAPVVEVPPPVVPPKQAPAGLPEGFSRKPDGSLWVKSSAGFSVPWAMVKVQGPNCEPGNWMRDACDRAAAAGL